MENIQDIISKIHAIVDSHKIADGQYCRWLWQDAKGSRELGVNPYGCADAANILYSIGKFPRDQHERAEFVRTMQAMQDPETGLFNEKTHYPIHTTAHCSAALELFDAAPLHPMKALEPYLEAGRLEEFLENIGWYDNPWTQSHNGAGIFVAMRQTLRPDSGAKVTPQNRAQSRYICTWRAASTTCSTTSGRTCRCVTLKR